MLAGRGIGLGAGLSEAMVAKQALPLGMAFFGAGEGGAEGAAKGYLEGLAMHGAGGIGQVLFDSLNSFAYSKVAAIALVIVVAVTLIDLLSQAIRSRLI